MRHRRHCHLLQLTRCMTTQISDISRSAGDEANKAVFRPKTPTLLSSESMSLSSSDAATQLHTDVDASDVNAVSDIANAMKRFQMASTGKRKSALHCTSLYYTAPQSSTICDSTLCHTSLHFTALYCTLTLTINLKWYTALHYTEASCTTIQFTALHYIVPQDTSL
jgi:hypothetical protein